MQSQGIFLDREHFEESQGHDHAADIDSDKIFWALAPSEMAPLPDPLVLIHAVALKLTWIGNNTTITTTKKIKTPTNQSMD